MSNLKNLTVGLSLALASIFASANAASPIEDAVAGAHRDAKDVARDVYRHPAQTLAFFDVKPEMNVVEIWPGGGWYADILAPLLRDKGSYVVAGFVTDPDSAPQWRIDLMDQLTARFAGKPEIYGKPLITQLGTPDQWTAAPASSADRVLTFRNVHNWLKGDYAEAMFQSFFQALKPGGILGVVEHRAPEGTTVDEMKVSGYMTEAYVIRLAEDAGFKLVERSQINANPADTARHPKGVWSLPPSLRMGDEDREKYVAIGESDRMTLKFQKPE